MDQKDKENIFKWIASPEVKEGWLMGKLTVAPILAREVDKAHEHRTVLMTAMMFRRVEMVQWMLSAGRFEANVDITAKDAAGRTAMFYLCYCAEVADQFLDKLSKIQGEKFTLNAIENNNRSFLSHVTRYYSTHALFLLNIIFKRKIDLSHPYEKKFVLDFIKLISRLKRKREKHKYLVTALTYEKISKIFKEMIELGADIEATPPGAVSPILYSIHVCEEISLQFFIDHYESKEMKYNFGTNVGGINGLHRLASFCSRLTTHEDIETTAQIILDNGADVNAISNHHNCTALIYTLGHTNRANRGPNTRLALFLISKGAKVNLGSRAIPPVYPLKLGIRYGMVEVTKVILEKASIDINALVAGTLDPPLRLACWKYTTRPDDVESSRMIEMLLEKGADTKSAVLFLCLPEAKRGSEKLFKLLLEKDFIDVDLGNKMPFLFYHLLNWQDIARLKLMAEHGLSVNKSYKQAICSFKYRSHRLISFSSVPEYRKHFCINKKLKYFCHRCLTRIRDYEGLTTCREGQYVCSCRVCSRCSYFYRGPSNEKLTAVEFSKRVKIPNISSFMKASQTDAFRELRESMGFEHFEALLNLGYFSLPSTRKSIDFVLSSLYGKQPKNRNFWLEASLNDCN